MDKMLSQLKYNPLEEESFLKLIKIKSFANFESEDCRSVFAYVALMNDKQSAIVKEFKDLKLRKDEALRVSGLSKLDSERVEGILGTIEDITIDYLIDQNDYWWAMIISNEITFYEYQRALAQMVNIIDDDKDKLQTITVKSRLLTDSEVIAERLEKYYYKIFNDDDLGKKAQSRHSFTPERMAGRNV